ncbi:unnamed protein product [Cuscuta campestris]|uniref:Wound-responsive family protein n=1 Tax=Cuscuta campestris TaxID=132261 RepID=A0A484K5S5_9ASTE|nr:unnamed protein product [Cuscuta campestris]
MNGGGGSRRTAWLVAASIAAVEALKDQGIARWNYPIRTLHQHAKSKVTSYCQTKRCSSSLPPSSVVSGKVIREANKVSKTERNMNRVVEMNCFGPSTVRF